MTAPGPDPARTPWTPGQIALVAARWFLGALFLYLGWKKAMDPVGFLKLVRQYNAIETPLLLNLVAAALPWFEVFCGLLLLLGVAVRGAATLLVAMLVPFTFLILQRALDLHAAGHIAFCAIKFDCGCGGGEVLICRKLVENTLLVALSLWLAASARHRLGLRTKLMR